MCRQSERNLLNNNISSRCPHKMANFGLLTAEIVWRVWGTPANFNGFRVLALLLPLTVHQNFARCLAVSCAGTLYIHFRVLLPLGESCQVQTSHCAQVLRSSILLHDTRPVGVSQTLRRGTKNGITELSQTAPFIFGWAAITLGIGPHCSYI